MLEFRTCAYLWFVQIRFYVNVAKRIRGLCRYIPLAEIGISLIVWMVVRVSNYLLSSKEMSLGGRVTHVCGGLYMDPLVAETI